MFPTLFLFICISIPAYTRPTRAKTGLGTSKTPFNYFSSCTVVLYKQYCSFIVKLMVNFKFNFADALGKI